MECPLMSSVSTIFKLNAVLLCVVNVICTVGGTILNSVVILSLWNSQLRRKLCYFMVFILAFFDLVVVVVIHPLFILQIVSCWMPVDVTEHGIEYIYILYAFSLTALLTMTLERYLAIVHPFFHKQFVTKSKLLTAFVLFQLPFNSPYIMKHWVDDRDIAVSIFLLNGIVLIVVCMLNFKLFFIARTLRKQAVVTLGNLDCPVSETRNNLNPEKFRLTFFSLRKISTCLLAVVCLFLCYIPWMIHFGIDIYRKDLFSDQNTLILHYWAGTFSALNSTLNCLIFFYKNSVLRRHAKDFLEARFGGRFLLHK